ncbi:hypothetical protein CPB84DRAFT_1850262 [Gymnopilus junonius]|uniref:Uncharacterized protein n=1 Tax=Gymnopilus junonius TaxID=109634 RepID=A0A9P5NHS2_GYMJU|nr:hypothetical protein CPB84DRAFT_1850262 [Gymnopilus junonius]
MSSDLELPPLPPRVSEEEAEHYYHGLHSKPRLIARTGEPWEHTPCPEVYFRTKSLMTVERHEKLMELWEDNIAFKVHDILNQNQVNWSSTDIVRIAYDDWIHGDNILWIGVWSSPTRLSYEVGIKVAQQCQRLLYDHGITNFEVELRESDLIQTSRNQRAFPPLLKPTDIIDPTAILREPFTTTLGITVCGHYMPCAEGTAGFFIAVPGVNKLFLVTAHHVLFPGNENKHVEYTNKSQLPYEVLDQGIVIVSEESRIAGVVGQNDAESQAIREDAELEKKKAERRVQVLKEFVEELRSKWSVDASRILGHVIFSPEIVVTAGAKLQQYTQDVAVIEVDASKIDPADFHGNFIDLGNKFTVADLTNKLRGNLTNPRFFAYPGNRLFGLTGTIPKEEIREPQMLDASGDPCLMVLKRGKSTDVTVGKANTYASYTRKYPSVSERDNVVSKQWLVIPLEEDSALFALKAATNICDVAYVTPIDFIMDVIRRFKPLANAYIMNAQSPMQRDEM